MPTKAITRTKWTSDTLHNFLSRGYAQRLWVPLPRNAEPDRPGKFQFHADRDSIPRFSDLEHLQRIGLRVVLSAGGEKQPGVPLANGSDRECDSLSLRNRANWREVGQQRNG